MGFNTARTLDPTGGQEAIEELNAALNRKMEDVEKRKRAASKKEQAAIEDKLRDEVRTLHEAYQFLSRKIETSRLEYEANSQRLRKSLRISEPDEEDEEEEEYEEEEEERQSYKVKGKKGKWALVKRVTKVKVPDDEEDDDVFGNVEELENNLCQLINETFKT